MGGYAVVDVETTGLFPGRYDRIVEVAVVQLSPRGEVEEVWDTLVNPGRDLGPQAIHGITAADVLHAPTFADVAGELASLLAGRAFVGHNASFDRRFITSSFVEVGWEVPISAESTVCTLRWAREFLPNAPRSLVGCCASAGIDLAHAHEALSDAMATAALIRHFLSMCGDQPPWAEALAWSHDAAWPLIPLARVERARRGVAAEREVPFLSRLVDSLPYLATSNAEEQYLALLDRALLDRVLSVRERDALVAAATDLGIDQPSALALHLAYLSELARAALADGVVTDEERGDLADIARLLDLSEDDVDAALGSASDTCADVREDSARFSLSAGDLVVFTGEMSRPREVWASMATKAGLVPHGAVTKKVALVVAADPDSLSGKARKACDYGIPIVTEEAFERMLGSVLA